MKYGADVWTVTKKNKNRITAVQVDLWRRSVKLTKLDTIPNLEIRRRIKVKKDLMTYIEEKRLIWYGHVTRAKAG